MLLVAMTDERFLAKMSELELTQGISLPGRVGKVSRDGVTAAYTHANDTLTVHIVEKPIFLSRAYCERRIEDWLMK